MSNFVFVGPGAENDEEVRKQVRSAAATHSHRVGPRKPKKSRKFADIIGEDGANGTGSGAGFFKVLVQVQRSALPTPEESSAAVVRLAAKRLKTGKSDKEPVEYLPSPSPSPKATTVGQVADDPFNAYPVAPQPWFPKVLFHLTDFMSRAWANLPLSQSERDKALIWVHQQTRSHPTYFYMNMLSVSGDLLDKGQIDVSVVPWLTAQVVSSLNEALADQSTALNIGTIMTVSRLTLHEIFLGDADAGQNVHRPALAKMIVMAGGVEKLNLPAIVLASWSWAERLIVQRTGVTMADLEPSLANEAVFCRGRIQEEDLKVLAGYHPRREWRGGQIVLSRRPISNQGASEIANPKPAS